MRISVRKEAVAVQSVQLRKLISEFLPATGLALISRDGRERWTPRMLVLCGILMHLLGTGALCDRFVEARDTVVAMYRTRRRPGKTYLGFVKNLLRQSSTFTQRLATHFRAIMPQAFKSVWHIDGRMVFGVDGTRVECPRTKANEKRLKRAGRKKTGPQFMLTTLFHLGSGLPWGFRRGIGKSSERKHLREMLDLLPSGAWLLADAGFTGYELFTQLQKRGIHFVVRVGRNVKLLQKLGYYAREKNGIVYLWSEKTRAAGLPPLVLRLVRLNTGRQKVCLLVSELDESVLSDAGVLELYRRRWQVEVFYRTLKRTMGRHKMESDAPDEAGAELDWSVLALWVLSMVSLRQLLSVGRSPHDCSVAGVLRVVRRACGPKRNCRISMRRFAQCLRQAVKDGYSRQGPKAMRKWPRKKNEPPAGAPKMRMATGAEVRAAQRLITLRQAA